MENSVRRRLMIIVLALLASGPLVGVAGVSGVAAQEEEARALLTEAAAAMAKVSSFHFELTTEGGVTTIMEELEVGAVEGDVVRPDRFRATVTAKFADFVSLDLHVVGIGDRLWVTDPRSGNGTMIEISISDADGEPLVDLLNPDRLLLQAVDFIQDPKIADTEEIDGVETTRIEGTFDPSSLDIGTPVPVALDLSPKPVAIWIDGDGRVVRLRLEGPLTEAEHPDIVRTLDLSDFDAEVEITPPAGA